MDAEVELLARLSRRDEHALAELYARLSANVYALARRMLRSPEEAEEVLQDTFVRLFNHAESFDPSRGSARAFIYTIARNEVLSRLRKRRARPTQAEGWDVHDPATALAAPADADPLDRVTVAGALARLEPDERSLLEQAFYQGYSHGELAERTGVPLGTVKSKLRRALLQLRAYLEEA